jgi:hypothetical protein
MTLEVPDPDYPGMSAEELALAQMNMCIRQVNTDGWSGGGRGGFREYCGAPAYTEGLAKADLNDPDLSYCAPHILSLQDEGHPDLKNVELPPDVERQAWLQAGFTDSDYDQAVRPDACHESLERDDEL